MLASAKLTILHETSPLPAILFDEFDFFLGHVHRVRQVEFSEWPGYEGWALSMTLRDALEGICIGSGGIVQRWTPKAALRVCETFQKVLDHLSTAAPRPIGPDRILSSRPEIYVGPTPHEVFNALKAQQGRSWKIAVD